MNRQNHQCDSASSINDLSDDLTEEIFFRLPINSVFRCGAAWKRWKSLISSPTFKNYYVSRNQNLRTVVGNKMYIKGCNKESENTSDLLMVINKQYCSSYCVVGFPQKLHKKRYSEVSGDYYLLDSSNGLFLCMAKSQNLYEIFICNPIIKQWIKLPEASKRISRHNCLGLSFTTQIDGAGIITSYKLLIFHLNPHQFEVLSSETATWKTYNINPLSRREWPTVANGLNIFQSANPLSDVYDRCPLSRHKFVAAVNGSGILHWVTGDPLRVVAYDPSDTDWYRMISFPHNGQMEGNADIRQYKDINVFNDKLRYFKLFRTPGQGNHLYIWTLEGYDDGGQWHLDEKILLSDFRFYANEYYKIGQFDLDRLYIWVGSTGELLAYDFWTQKLMVIDKPMDGWKPYEQLPKWYMPLTLPIWPATIKVQREQ